MKSIITILLVLISFIELSYSQNTNQKKQIEIVYGGNFSKDETNYPGASIFNNDGRQVQFRHEGIDVWCDIAVMYQDQNKIKAYGEVFLQQGDSVKMNCKIIEYDGNTKLATAKEDVVLRNEKMQLDTELLYFDRTLQQCYYTTGGTVTDPENILTSQAGTYFIETQKFQFKDSVNVKNPSFILDSYELDYYEKSKNAYLYGPSTITGEDYVMYCERGFYDTKIEQGYGIKNTRIDYNQRIIKGDSVYFDKLKSYASATNNIKIIDTVNNGLVKGHYGEVWKEKDSMFVTKRAVAINLIENDSIFIHGDTLMVTGKENERIVRAFRNAKFYKSDLSGKCDSIHSSQVTGITQLIRKIPQGTRERDWFKHNPIIWNGKNQMTGDKIHLVSNVKTEKLDSLKVLNNAFMIEKDTIGDGFNQVKGKDLFGLFDDNKLYQADIIKNAESVYYIYDNTNFVGIDKVACGSIKLTFTENEIDEIANIDNPEGHIYKEEDLPKNARKLSGFYWRGDEYIGSKDDIFDEDDNNIELVKIKGIEDPISVDLEEMGRTSTLSEESVPSKNKTIQPQQKTQPKNTKGKLEVKPKATLKQPEKKNTNTP